MNPVVLVVSRSGGVGKTLLAQLVAGVVFERPWPYRPWSFAPVAVDTMRIGERSKLGRLFVHCVEMPLASTLDLDGRGTQDLWFNVASAIERGGCVMDFGANVAPFLAQVLAQLEIDGGFKLPSDVTAIVPATASGQSLANAREAIVDIGFSRVWPCRTVVVLNEIHGDFNPLRISPSGDLGWIMEQAARGMLSIVRLPRCKSQVWSLIEEGSRPLLSVVAMKDDDFASQFELADPWRRAEARMFLSSWARDAIADLREAGVFKGVNS